MKKIRRALISVSDKTGLIDFAKFLAKQKVEILSTGGTLKTLKDAGIQARAVEDFTGFPEILEGRVKTLHPKIHGGLLYRRDKQAHEEQAAQHGIEPIDLVAVNLYPFEEVIQKPNVDMEMAIENIDIGGPSMLRSAAKNFKAVTVICDPVDYESVMQDMKSNKGEVSEETRKKLMQKVFARTSAYDMAIAGYFNQSNGTHSRNDVIKRVLPTTLNLDYHKIQDLRYGENPNQAAAHYRKKGTDSPFVQHHGKELSYNNILDIEAVLDVLREFDDPAACVIKHNNPSGIAEGNHIMQALDDAIDCDAMSAFGGIIGLNQACDLKTAALAYERLKFFEVIVAPSFDLEAMKFLKKRENLRIITADTDSKAGEWDMRFLSHGLLLQEKDRPLKERAMILRKNMKVMTQIKPSMQEMQDLLFAFKCVKTVKSNAIVLTQGRKTVGIGAGQMSRVDSVEIACRKAGYRAENSMLASDAFFPMPDSIEMAADAKIKAIIQPGGSVRDADVIAACDRLGIAMVFTGERHFRH